MTPEQAAYHRLMLLAGLPEAFEQELDQALEQEDPLTPLTLELACCMSDLNRTLSVLHNHLLDHPANEHQVYELVLAGFRRQYTEGKLDELRVCQCLTQIQSSCDAIEPWIDLYPCLYDYELLEEGMICDEVFRRCFRSVFLDGVELDAWALQKEYNPKKKKSLMDFFRKKL